MPRLVLQSGETRWELTESPSVIGRSVNNVPVHIDLSADGEVSRRHLELLFDNDAWWAHDERSANDTLLNGIRIKAQGPQRLAEGDCLQLGQTRLTVKEAVGNPPPEPEPELAAPPEPELIVESGPEPVVEPVGLAARLEAVSTAIARALQGDLAQAIEMLCTSALPIFRADRCAVLRADLQMVACHPRDTMPSTQLAAAAIQEATPKRWPDTPELMDRGPLQTFSPVPIRAALYMPCPPTGPAMGCLCLQRANADLFELEDVVLARAFSDAIALIQRLVDQQEATRPQQESLANFRRLVSSPVAGLIESRRGRIRPESGDYRNLTVLFTDFRGFTQWSQGKPADDVTEMICAYFSRMVPILEKRGGVIDKFVGDAIVAVFGSPNPDPDHVTTAVHAAIEIQTELRQFNLARQAAGEPTLHLGVGVHTGSAAHGFIGTRDRMEYTVIGDTVNRASRLCDGAQGGEILISDAVYNQVWMALRGGAQIHPTSIPTKHEGEMTAYAVRSPEA